MAPTVLITGAGGLLGRAAVPRLLSLGLNVTAHHRSHGDLLAPGAAQRILDSLKPDIVVHLAWSASGTPGYRTDPTNDLWVAASADLAAACTKRGIPLYCTGSAVDDVATDPDLYTRSKHRLRLAMAELVQAGTVRWLRPHYVFDPQAGRPALVAEALRCAASNERMMLLSPGAAHDFVLASDVGSAIAAAVHNDLSGVIEIGAGRTHQVPGLVERLGASWQPSEHTQGTHPSTPPANIRPLREVGWAPNDTEEFFARD